MEPEIRSSTYIPPVKTISKELTEEARIRKEHELAIKELEAQFEGKQLEELKLLQEQNLQHKLKGEQIKRNAEEAKKYESEGITAPESVTNEQKQEINIEEKIEVTNKDAEITSEENFEENIVPEEKKDQDEKEYTSDSVFAKLNELKKED